jgi:Amt family ammonium transporter
MNKQQRRFARRLIVMAMGTLILGIFGTTVSFAQEAADPVAESMAALQVSIDSTFVFIAAMFVFFMQAGFAFLEAGMISQRGAVNSLMENFMDAAIGGIAFFATGFALALGTDNGSGLFGTTNFFLSEAVTFTAEGGVDYGSGISIYMLFFFQFAFAATAGTIATGAMAERVNFWGKIIYSAVVAGITYPIVIHWIWGGGWLSQQGFLDFAGSTAVHLSGGMVALLGAIVLGPRIGRVWGSPPKPHNLAFAALGTMILWLGWYGFNPGSALSMGNNGFVGLVAVTTTLAACAGAFSATLFVYFRTGKWDVPAALNGSLAGLVGITAGCAFVMPWSSLAIGAIAGLLVILTADVMERLKIDDAAGAFAVHGVCGIFGTLAIGIFGQPELGANGLLFGGGVAQLGVQALGAGAVALWMGLTSYGMFVGLKAVGLLRIPAKAEAELGIDLYEHGATIVQDSWATTPATPEPVTPAIGTAPAGAGD